MAYTIVKAEKEHIPMISTIHAKSWKGGYEGIVPKSYLENLQEDAWINTFENFFEKGMIQCAIAYDKEQPVGVVSFGKAREEKFSEYGEIISLYVLSEYFGKEVGKALLKYALNCFANESVFQCYLWVLEENKRGRRSYEKNGFYQTEDVCHVEIEKTVLKEIRYCKSSMK